LSSAGEKATQLMAALCDLRVLMSSGSSDSEDEEDMVIVVMLVSERQE
jgi:hypothetical protein